MAEETSKRVARENFAMATVPILQSASFEPLLHQPRDEEEEGIKEFLFIWIKRFFVLFRTYR
jgi:hypothetical protein